MRTRYFFVLCKVFCTCIILLTGSFGSKHIIRAQNQEQTGIKFEKKLEITISNSLTIERKSEQVIIPLELLNKKAPDFNRNFYRVKYSAGMFEPLDIPSQIYAAPGKHGVEVLAFVMDFAPKERKKVELWYNPEGTGLPDYPLKVQSFGKWYHMDTNIAWENELIAYRSYSGIVDYFAKTYPHLRLHDLPPDSYHNEGLWGLDPYVVGTKPGLGGILLFDGSRSEKCYGGGDDSPLSYVHSAFGGGPVCAGASVEVKHNDTLKVTSHFTLFTGRHDNDVTVEVPKVILNDDLLIAPGMQKFDGEWFVSDKRKGYFLSYGSPAGEYGTIATALIWNPDDVRGEEETEDGHFIKLKPDSNGIVRYRIVAVWYRGSADQPESSKAFERYIQGLAQCFTKPVMVSIQ